MARRAWALLALLAVACTPDPVASPGAGGVARFDGVYRGTTVTSGNGVECSAGSTAIRITVQSGRAWAGPRRRRHRMDGRVTEDGQIALQDDTGAHSLRGNIRGDQLTATEDLPRGASMGRQEPGMPTACPGTVTATRAN